MLKDSIDNGPYQFKPEITLKDTDGFIDICHPQRIKDLAGQDKLRYDSYIKAVNILLLGLPVDIYTLINHYQTAKEIWDHIKELIEGIKMSKQERESMLYDELDKFTYEPGESIHSYYLRYAKLINDIKMIPMSMSSMQINTKFVNHLQPEWSRFVAPTFLPTDDPIVSLNKAMIFLSLVQVTVKNVQGRQSQGYAGNAGKNQASGAKVVNTVGNARAHQPRVIICYNCHGKGHIANQCSAKKKVKDSKLFKDKMLLAQAQEAGVVLNDEQQDFLADSLEETDDYCDDEATANAIFMANLSHVGSINDDTVEPRYDSDILSEVPHYDTYHDTDMLGIII
ncbi:retrovirus-related pol polyprotein from transposon TNT 1-94 [Tanacetum coccineum]